MLMSDIPYSTISVSGADAFDFLQAQLAADLAQLPETGLAAWCNPKGRVICLFRVRQTADGYDLALPTELADAVIKRLAMFRFRSKVEFAAGDVDAALLGIVRDYNDWRLANLRAGIPEILVAQSEEFTPHMLNLDLLGAVSVSKGCYPGQEIVAAGEQKIGEILAIVNKAGFRITGLEMRQLDRALVEIGGGIGKRRRLLPECIGLAGAGLVKRQRGVGQLAQAFVHTQFDTLVIQVVITHLVITIDHLKGNSISLSPIRE